MQTLEGKTAVVTGAGSGIGRAFADRFARAGMRVVLADIEEPKLDEAVAAINDDGGSAIGVITDVSDPGAVERLRDRSLEAFDAVHVVCNNAGVGGGIGDQLVEWQWVMNVNFWGVVHGIHAFLPLLVEQDEGHIVNTSSMAGILPGFSAYSASKWAVRGMSEGLFNQLRTQGSNVGVSCLCPGWVRTEIGNSDRNRPEWAAADALDDDALDDDPAVKMRRAFVQDAIASGKPPAEVAELVHDAILAERLWVFTEPRWVVGQRPRLEAMIAGDNPPDMGPLGGG